jgi:hypothetical protein
LGAYLFCSFWGPKATKEAEKQAKRALEEEEALVEKNLVETLSQRPKRLKK